MNKPLTISVGTASLLFFTAASAGAANLPQLESQQNARVLVKSHSGGKPAANSSVKIEAYLSTRYPASTAPQHQGNPVGRVVMTFPAGSSAQPSKTGKPTCNQPAGQGALVMSKCARSLIGEGWALVNTGQNLGAGGLPQARPQLTGAPAPCLAETGDPLGWNMYSQTWVNGTLSCVPWSHLWNKVRVYQGGITKPGGRPDPNAVIFVSENIASVVSFAGTVSKNVLTVNLPALYGSGSYPGELFFGWVLSDFRVVINTKNFLRSGNCVKHNFQIKTQVSYSQRKLEDGKKADGTADPSEDVRLAPQGHTLVTNNAC